MVDLQSRLERIADAADGTMGLAVLVPGAGESFRINAGELFPMASVFKLPLLVHLFHLAEAGGIGLTDYEDLRAEDQAPGSGVLKELLPGARVSVWDLAVLMTIVSDNTATDILYARVGGGEAITATMERLGLRRVAVRMDCKSLLNVAVGLDPGDRRPETLAEVKERLRQARFDYAGPAFRASLEGNCATPDDVAQLLALIERRAAATPGSCDQMIDVLLRQQLNERIPLRLPRPFKVAHKTGTLGTTRNDAGIVYLPNGDPIVICALTKGVPVHRWQEGDSCIAEAALAVYTAYA
jgi:beta-lactamase class A